MGNSYKKANKVNMDKASSIRNKRAEYVAAYVSDVASADAAKKAMVAANGVSVAKTTAYNKAKAASIKAAAASTAANKTAAARQGDLTKALADEKKANDGNDAAVKAAKKN